MGILGGPDGSPPTLLRPTAKGGIARVTVTALAPNADLRGSLCEIHRDAWKLAPRPVQWDFVASSPKVLRGVHVHRLRHDYLIILEGTATIGLTDMRRRAGSFRQAMSIATSGARPEVVMVPPGVAHGIYAHDRMLYLYGLTRYYDGDDQLGCRFDDPALGVAWPDRDPVRLSREAKLPGFEELLRQFESAGGVADDL